MADLTEIILKNLNFDEVKNKKIFQKFLSQKNLEERSHQQMPRYMKTITEESAILTNRNISPHKVQKIKPRHKENMQTQQKYEKDEQYTEIERNYNTNKTNDANQVSPDSYQKEQYESFQNKQTKHNQFEQTSQNKQDQFSSNKQDQFLLGNHDQFSQSKKYKSPPKGTNEYMSKNNNEQMQESQWHKKGNGSIPPSYQQQSSHQMKRSLEYEEDKELAGHSLLIPGQYNSINKRFYPVEETYNPQKQESYNREGYTSQPSRIPSFTNSYSGQFARDNRWNDHEYNVYQQQQQNQFQQQPPSYPPPEFNRFRGKSGSNSQNGRSQGIGYNDQEYRSRIQTQHSNLDYQTDRMRNLENRCIDYEAQISRISSMFADFKDQTFRDASQAKTTILDLEQTIQNLQEMLYDFQIKTDSLSQENEKLKQKISHEILIRTKCEEEARDESSQLEETKDALADARREALRKEDEIIHFKSQIEILKNKHTQFIAQQDIILNQLRDDKESLVREVQNSQQYNKQYIELQEKHSNIFNENKRLYSQADSLKLQISELNSFIEQQKQEIYAAKHNIIDKSQIESQLHTQLENSYTEILQLKGLLQRAEASLIDKKDIIPSFQPNVQPIPHKSMRDGDEDRQTPAQLSQRQTNFIHAFENNQQAAPKRDRIYSQNSLPLQQNYGDKSHLQDSPINRTKRMFNRNLPNGNSLQVLPDVRQSSIENQMISQQLKNKNINTPANFLSWEVPDQKPASKKTSQHMSQSNQVDIMYKNIQQKLEKDQQYVSQQYKMQQDQHSLMPSQQQQKEHNQANNERHVQLEYSQIYNDYMNDKFNGSPKRANISAPDGSRNIQNIENNLMMFNLQKDKLKNELQKLEESKIKSGNNIRRKNEINDELQLLENNISSAKTKLRDVNVLRPH